MAAKTPAKVQPRKRRRRRPMEHIERTATRYMIESAGKRLDTLNTAMSPRARKACGQFVDDANGHYKKSLEAARGKDPFALAENVRNTWFGLGRASACMMLRKGKR